MELGTLIGLGVAFGAIFVAIFLEGASPMAIILIPPILLVLGGTFGAAMAGSMMRDTKRVGSWFRTVLLAKVAPADEVVDTVVKLAERARREGLLALEDAARDVDDDYLRKGLELAIDGTDPEELREILESQLDAKRREDRLGARFFTDMGGYSPTIGIIGTVIGLIHVLGNLSEPDKLGHLIAGAFVATLWGVMMANVVWLPFGKKMARLSELECQKMELIIEGILAIQAGSNPRVVAQRLRSLLPAPEGAPAGKAA